MSVRARLARLGASLPQPQARWQDTGTPVKPPVDGALRLLTLNVAHGRKLATHQALLSSLTVRSGWHSA